MNFGGFSWLAIASFYFLFAGLWKLITNRKYKEFIIINILVFGPLLIIWHLLQIAWDLPTELQRLWFAGPWIIVGIFWLLSGFFVRTQVEAILNSSPSLSENVTLNSRNILKFVISVCAIFISICFWLYGISTPPKGLYFVVGLPAITAGIFLGILGIIPDSKERK